MSIQANVGFSQKLKIDEAIKDALTQAHPNLQNSKAEMAIIFHTIHYNPSEFIPIVSEILKDTKIVGCSAAGIISSDFVTLHGLAILTISMDDVYFATGLIDDVSRMDMRLVGSSLAKNVIHNYGQHNRQIFVYFTDGLASDNSKILKGIQDIFGNAFPIIGAGSCDDFHFKKSYQFVQNTIMTNGAAGFLLGGHLNIGIGSRHGWKPLGKPRFIEKVENNLIKIIDGKQASSIYDEYFGKKAEHLRTEKMGQISILYPLGIYIEGEDEYLLRNVISIQSDGSLLCQGDVPEDSEVHIMMSNKESCIQAATDAAMNAQNSLGGIEAKAVVVFESLARQKLLGRFAFQEIKAIKEVFGYTIPIIGMYSYGEICPTNTLENFDKMHLQNESITVLAFG